MSNHNFPQYLRGQYLTLLKEGWNTIDENIKQEEAEYISLCHTSVYSNERSQLSMY